MDTRHRALIQRLAVTSLGVLVVAGLVATGCAVAASREDSRLGERIDASEHDEAALHASQQDLARQIAELEATARQLATRAAAVDAALAAQVDAQAVSDKVAPSVFEIDAGPATGTAWVVSNQKESSLLVTNYHVVADVYSAGFRNVNLRNGKALYAGRITTVDEPADLALVSVNSSLPALVRSTDPAAVGEPVLVVGSSLGLEGSVSTGIVSGLRTERGRSLIQFTAPVSPGNSGGPVVDRLGRVVGITELKLVEPGAEGLGFAIPVSAVCGALKVC